MREPEREGEGQNIVVRIRVSVHTTTPIVLSTQLHPSHVFDAHEYTWTRRQGRRERAVRWRRQASSAEIDNPGGIGVRGHTGRRREGMEKRMAEKGRRRWMAKRHHKLPAVSPRPTVLALLLHHRHVHRPSRYSLPPYGIRTVSRHQPPRALYGPGRSEMVACLSGSPRAAVKAADLVSRRLLAKSRAAKKMRRRSQVFSGSFRRTKRRRCPPPCQGSILRRRCIPIGIPRMRTRGEGVWYRGAHATGGCHRDATARWSAAMDAHGIRGSRLVASVGACGLDR